MVHKVHRLIFVFLLLFLLLGANFVYALEINYPKVPGADPPQDFLKTASPEDVLSLYVKYIVYFFIWLSGFLAFAMLVYGGIGYLTASGSPEKMVNAKQQIFGAFLGLLILFSIYLILNTISPGLTELKITALESFNIPQPQALPHLKTEKTGTSIDIELPFGRIINSIFEEYVSEYPKPTTEKLPRMTRITNNIRAIVSEDHKTGIADMLLEQSLDLDSLANKCSCKETKPVTPCGNISTGLTTYQCSCSNCSATEPVTSDPCANVRSEIQEAEEKNISTIYGGTNVEQLDKELKSGTITTSLTKEITKTEEEVSLLKEELDKLKRSKKFLLDCPSRLLNSWTQLTSKKDYFDDNNYLLRDTKFWDNINIKYFRNDTKWYIPSAILGYDYATFYCVVSGNVEQEEVFPTPDENALTGDESIEKADAAFSESMACSSSEAPVGEIIDRTERIAQLLINKLETLVGWEKKLIKAVDDLHVLISQCSSQRGCERRCSCFPRLCGKDSGCIGWAFSCADSSPAYPGACLDRDGDTPCPYKEINEKLEEITNIWLEIQQVIEGKATKNTPETIGIINIVDELAPNILNDLENNIRIPMKECSSDSSSQNKALFSALDIRGAVTPGGKILTLNCQISKLENGVEKQTPYGDCFEECYLEKTQNKHRECVQKCLNKSNDDDLKKCFNELNFYCCTI